ncbi:MAG: hypothetical protein LBC45_03255 [Chlamydiales bacterium]|jgi:hypothetical protein|nr:hypothetical protein [Chlamydiales bacterium]
MTSPIGKQPTTVTRDDEFEAFVKEKANKLVQKPCDLVKETLKAKADACIDQTCSPHAMKDMSKKSVRSYIDVCIDFSAKKAIDHAITSIKNQASQE